MFVNLPKPGDTVDRPSVVRHHRSGEGGVRAVRPVAGEVVEVNGALERDPAVVNRDPYGEGWMITLRVANPAELDSLLSASAYRGHIGE